MNTHLDELINRWREGQLSDEELRRLTEALATPEGRAALRGDWFLEAALPEALRTSLVLKLAQKMDPMAAPQAKQWTGWPSWRPLTAAAAGIVFGMLCTSVVFGYVMPRAVELLRENFENAAMNLGADFPKTAGVWSGDVARIVAEDEGITPKEGTRMLRLEPVKDLWNAQSYIVDLRQLKPAPAGEVRVVRLAASFRAAPSEIRDRYMARAAAFVEAPGEIDSRWMNDLWGSEENHAVATAARATTFQPGTPGWQTLNLTMDLPPDSRFLVISLRAATMHGKAEMRAAHYLDDVRVTLETLQTREARP